MADSPSGSRPLLRVGGIALLGVGLIAATVGLVTSVTAGDGVGTARPSASANALPASGEATAPAQAAPVPSAEVTAPASAVPVPPAATAAPPAAASPAPSPDPQPPVAAAPPAGTGGDGSAASGGTGGGQAARAPLRVYNNSLIPRLAAQAKADFEARGWNVVEDGNYPETRGVVAASTAYFRPGTAEEPAAKELGREFGLRVEPRFAGIAQATDGVIVILAQDYQAGPKSS